MRITANGTLYDVPPQASVADFVRARGLDLRFVVVEWNGEPLERAGYEEAKLSDGDRLELVRAVAGG